LCFKEIRVIFTFIKHKIFETNIKQIRKVMGIDNSSGF
jgi:hypothetical protein